MYFVYQYFKHLEYMEVYGRFFLKYQSFKP